MSKFDQVTVVSVSGHNDGAQAIEAILRTLNELPGASGLLLAARRPPNLPPTIQFVPVDWFDYFQYSLFIVHCLHYHVQTDYVLIVQDDGWALNGKNWNDDWFEYDYVGAPSHAAGIGGKLHHWYSWVGLPNPAQVFNGGFSFRSRKLLEAPTRHGICYKIFPESVLRNEDVQLCVVLRDSLERRGIKFAPSEIALHFSVEFMHPVVHRNLDFKKLFGHHSPRRKLRPDSVVEIAMTADEIQRTFGEAQLVALLKHYGYIVKCRRGDSLKSALS